MAGCARRSAASSWFLNLATARAVILGSIPCLRRIFSATVRSGSGSVALYTVASALAPITSAIRYFPSCFRFSTGSTRRNSGASLPEHLHRLRETGPHALERAGEGRDL